MKKNITQSSSFGKNKSRGIVVVGSVALDTIKTPFGEVKDALGGSATYFSVAASYFAPVKMVAVVGKDFPARHIRILEEKGIDTSGLVIDKTGRTFRWRGYYEYDLSNAHTLETQLNVFARFIPVLSDEHRRTRYLFLGNIDPVLQKRILRDMASPALVGADTMNFWIESKPDDLKEMISRVDVLIINEAEAREFSRQKNLVRAARKIISMGPRFLVVKRGEYGALVFNDENKIFSAPGYPLEQISDPTGAGDSFAGGFMGYLASLNATRSDRDLFSKISRAVIYGSVMASFNVESFSLKRLISLEKNDIARRFREFERLTCF